MDATPKKRTKILALRDHAGKSLRQIADHLKIGKSTVGRIINRRNSLGHTLTLRKGNCGRKRKTTKRDDAILLRNRIKNPKKDSRELTTDLRKSGVSVSDLTVRRRLIENGRLARKPLQKQPLTQKMKH